MTIPLHINMGYSYETSDLFCYELLKELSRKNRRKATLAERKLWEHLRSEQLGVPFRRQHIIGMFIADFCCLPERLIVETDGGYHSLPEQRVSDEERANWLNEEGYRLLHFTNEEVLYDIDKVITTIKDNLQIR